MEVDPIIFFTILASSVKLSYSEGVSAMRGMECEWAVMAKGARATRGIKPCERSAWRSTLELNGVLLLLKWMQLTLLSPIF